ncbi:PR-1-like protein, partial [Stipitochalara longipes BDJ]
MFFKNPSIPLSLILLIFPLSSACGTITHSSLIFSVISRQQSTDPAHTDDITFEKVALDNQNFYRVEHGATSFTWSTSLAFSSLAWSKQCVWTHSNAATGQQLPYGENVFGGYPTIADGIDCWGLERVNYNWNNPGFSESTGHFTQIVWKTSTQVGCSRTLCSPGWWVVCHYSPPGNVLGILDAFTDNVGKRVSG